MGKGDAGSDVTHTQKITSCAVDGNDAVIPEVGPTLRVVPGVRRPFRGGRVGF